MKKKPKKPDTADTPTDTRVIPPTESESEDSPRPDKSCKTTTNRCCSNIFTDASIKVIASTVTAVVASIVTLIVTLV